jgi:hypothetical protein
MGGHRRRGLVSGACLAAALGATTACSPRHIGINRMAEALAASGSVYASDDDPEFVRLAAPSTLKTVEMLLSEAPDHPQLLLTACSGFTEYAYAFLHVEAEVRPAADAPAARDLRLRANHMYRRSRTYCLHGLALRHSSITRQALLRDPSSALTAATAADVPLLYWSAVAWGGELSLADDQLRRIGELVVVRALLTRARGLNDTYDHGAIHEALIALDGLPRLFGGSPAAARADFARAVELSQGHSAFAYVALATAVTDRAASRRLLEQALAVDINALPDRRLANLVVQRYARMLLARPSR